MSSKASGEPSMMLSVSVLYALRRAVAAARNALPDSFPSAIIPSTQLTLPPASTSNSSAVPGSDAKSGTKNSQSASHSAPESTDTTGTSYIIGSRASDSASDSDRQQKDTSQENVSHGGNAFLVLEAPVTTAHLREAVGQFDIAEMIRAAAGKASVGDREPEYHSSGEWVFVH